MVAVVSDRSSLTCATQISPAAPRFLAQQAFKTHSLRAYVAAAPAAYFKRPYPQRPASSTVRSRGLHGPGASDKALALFGNMADLLNIAVEKPISGE